MVGDAEASPDDIIRYGDMGVIAGYDPQSGAVWSAKRGLSFFGGECGD